MLVGVDTGGTFTDFVAVHAGRVLTYKTPSTPRDYTQGIVEGIDVLLQRTGADRFTLVHGTTVATNAVLERKGARTALITTRGFRDVLQIARQDRPALYNLYARPPEPLVDRALRLEIDERVSAEGEALTPLTEDDIGPLLDQLEEKNVQAIAVCLLFSFLHPEHERTITRAARTRGWTVSASHEIAAEFREYERTSTTVINAYVSPVMEGYLERLGQAVEARGGTGIRIVVSNGGSISASGVRSKAAATLLSGPAAGVIGALSVARQSLEPQPRLITFDMGGTSTDVSLVDGDFEVTTEGTIGSLPVRLPMIDIHTVGAGGGSLAYVDAGGALHVGPQSAGADPGPACYGRGDQPTVTDANMVLGRLTAERFLGGRMRLDGGRARNALQRLNDKMGGTARAAAEAVTRTVNATMERAIRTISVERGHDARDFTLVSFGGAGGLHACALAAAMRMPRVFVPRHPGVLSAWGALSADVKRDYAQTMMAPVDDQTQARLKQALRRLDRQAVDDLKREGFAKREIRLQHMLDLRYAGQSFELSVPYDGKLSDAADAFHQRHEKRYGHCAPGERLQLVTVRTLAVGPVDKPRLERIERGATRPRKSAVARDDKLPVYDREALVAGNRLRGPALIVEPFSTTYLPPAWRCTVDDWGNLVLEP